MDKQICDLDQMYYASVAPVVIKNHVIVGVSGDDLDIPGYLESRDPETGDLQWHWYCLLKPASPDRKRGRMPRQWSTAAA